MKKLSTRLADLPPEQLNAISKRLSNKRENKQQNSAISRRSQLGAHPVSYSQFRLWVLDQIDPGNSVYNIHLTFRFHGSLNKQALNKAINNIVERHETLRTTFDFIDGDPVQVVHAFHPLEIRFWDLAHLPSKDQESEALRITAEEAEKGFDLKWGPLFRPSLVRLNDTNHIILLTMHHIISDGWSNGILVYELSTLYESFCMDEPSPLSDLPIQYTDYVRWQREWMQGDVLKDHLSYWKQQLTGAPPLLNLPADRPRLAKQAFRGAWEYAMLPSHLMESLNDLSKRESVTLFMTLLAGFQILLYRYSGQDDISAGIPVANRDRVEIEGLIGLFVNTVTIRSDLSGNPTFQDFLGRIRKTVLSAYAHQDLPFEKVVEALEPERDLSHQPLFQSMFVFNETNAQARGSRLANYARPADNLGIKLMKTHSSTSMFDLTLHVSHFESKWTCSAEYNSDMFEAGRIKRMLGHFQRLLESIISDPHYRISDLTLLSETERYQLLREWNETSKQFEHIDHFFRLFRRQVERIPDATAVVFEEHSLSYGELNRRANCVANHLQKIASGPDLLAGVFTERSLEMLIAIFGVIKAGGAYIPLDPSHPDHRILQILDEAHIRIVLAQKELKGRIRDESAKIICLDSDWETISQRSAEDPVAQVTEDDLAYAIYTSGSTGTPKGAMISLESLRNRLLWMQDLLQLGEGDVILHKTPHSFDVSVWELFLPFLVGARLVIARPGGHQDSAYLAALIEKEKIGVLHFVPSMLEVFLEEEGLDRCRSLNRVICSGEALTPKLQQRFFSAFQSELYNLYGPTEATIDVTFWKCGSDGMQDIVPIGRPISNTELYILDGQLNPVPVGVPGQLFIGGMGLARGYMNRGDLTAESFIPHRFGEAGSRLYATGDMARYLADGNIEYLGRRDHQVKIKGYRIELGEIESILNQHPSIRESVAILREGGSNLRRLVAYVVEEWNAGIDLAEVRGFLAERLPVYMIPNNIVVIGEIPRTQTGKIERSKLPAPPERSEVKVPYEPPVTPLEMMLVEIWKEVLGLQKVGRMDNFFELGGDSIRGLQVVARARAKGVKLSLQLLYPHPTVYSLAQAVTEGQIEDDQTATYFNSAPFALISTEDRLKLPEDIVDAYPISQAQIGLLFDTEGFPESHFYHEISSYHLEAQLDVSMLKQTVENVIALHPILRTSFDLVRFDRPMQLVHRTASIEFHTQDISNHSAEEQWQIMTKYTEADKKRPFKWSSAPLCRISIYIRSERTFQFIISYHHAILDGWSTASLLYELFSNYLRGLKSHVAIIGSPPQSSFRDFIAVEESVLKSEETKEFWARKLDGCAPCKLPHWPFYPVDEESGYLKVPISPELSESTVALAKAIGVPLKSVLLAAHVMVIGLFTGADDILTGLLLNGRLEVKDGEKVLGYFLNPLPFRLKPAAESWTDLIQNAYRAECELLPYRRYPLPQVLVDRGRQDLFDTYFVLTDYHGLRDIARLDGMRPLGATHYGNDSYFTMIAGFTLNPTNSDLQLALYYDSSRLGHDQIRVIGDYYSKVLNLIVANQAKGFCIQDLVTEPEGARRTSASNNNDREAFIHRRFERQARQKPDEIAAGFEGRLITYGELNSRSNQLAHYLRRSGVGPETLVGVYLERSLEMLIALLATIKAGAAYVPIDPDHPEERIAMILEDARCAMLVTQESLAAKSPRLSANAICLDREWNSIACENETDVSCEVTSDSLAYVIYTSGSTGRPKGVQITHQSVANLLISMERHLNFTKENVLFAVTTISFDISALELFAPITVGGRVELASPDDLSEINRLINKMEECGASVLQATPSMWQLLLEAGWEGKSDLKILSGGDILPRELAEELLKRGCGLWNLYGPTESTIWSAIYDVDSMIGSVPIGRPIANTEIYVLDEQRDPVPLGVTGELYISGVGLARGYLNRSDLTAENFIPNRYGEAGSRLYRTGDIGRYLADGNIEFLGRRDHQVKIRGYRVELGEIESVLNQHPSVRESAVIVAERGGEKQLVAYAAVNGEGVSRQELRSEIAKKLPEYMRARIEIVNGVLPRTGSGKIDRKALAKRERIEEKEGVREAARTETEREIVGIWEEVLGVKGLGINEDFFDLGGHSLLALRLIARLREVFGVELSMRGLFEFPTVARLAMAITEHNR